MTSCQRTTRKADRTDTGSHRRDREAQVHRDAATGHLPTIAGCSAARNPPSRRPMKLCSPSTASWLRKMPGSSNAVHSCPASGPWPSPARALADMARTPGRVCRAIGLASSVARVTSAPGRHHLLRRPDPHGLGGAGHLGGEHEAHRVAQPSCAGARKVAPPGGTIPRPIASCRKRTSPVAATMSAVRAGSTGKVNGMPLTAITTGLGTGSARRCRARLPPGRPRRGPDPSGSEPLWADNFYTAGRILAIMRAG